MADHFDIPNATPAEPRGIDGLRERAAGALEAALGFIEEHGNEMARLRAAILVEIESPEHGVEALAARQREDGGFAALGQVLPACVDRGLRGWDADEEILGTVEALSILADWGLLYEGIADRAVDALYRAQCEDGSFGAADAGEAEDPRWRVVTTALLAGLLGRTRSARPEMLRGAGAYLAGHWSVETLRGQGWPVVAAFAHYFTNVYDEQRETALPWCARELERGLLAHEYGAGDVMRVLFYCEASALPGVTFDANALLAQLMDEQRADGSVGGEGTAAADRVATTLDAMHFTLRICRSAGP